MPLNIRPNFRAVGQPMAPYDPMAALQSQKQFGARPLGQPMAPYDPMAALQSQKQFGARLPLDMNNDQGGGGSDMGLPNTNLPFVQPQQQSQIPVPEPMPDATNSPDPTTNSGKSNWFAMLAPIISAGLGYAIGGKAGAAVGFSGGAQGGANYFTEKQNIQKRAFEQGQQERKTKAEEALSSSEVATRAGTLALEQQKFAKIEEDDAVKKYVEGGSQHARNDLTTKYGYAPDQMVELDNQFKQNKDAKEEAAFQKKENEYVTTTNKIALSKLYQDRYSLDSTHADKMASTQIEAQKSKLALPGTQVSEAQAGIARADIIPIRDALGGESLYSIKQGKMILDAKQMSSSDFQPIIDRLKTATPEEAAVITASFARTSPRMISMLHMEAVKQGVPDANLRGFGYSPVKPVSEKDKATTELIKTKEVAAKEALKSFSQKTADFFNGVHPGNQADVPKVVVKDPRVENAVMALMGKSLKEVNDALSASTKLTDQQKEDIRSRLRGQ